MIGYEAEMALEEGLKRTIASFRSQTVPRSAGARG